MGNTSASPSQTSASARTGWLPSLAASPHT
ncbi:hypothetical protein A2U01_0085377, partial [Trifolium medium]|nr:hypothetical protein [Trifolium medium]